MKKNILQLILLCSFCHSAIGQWQQSEGTSGLNMQSLMSHDMYNFAGGATGAYVSTDNAQSYVLILD